MRGWPVTGPALSRAECQRLAGLVRWGLKAGFYGTAYEDFLTIADLVEAFSIADDEPATDPTRKELARLAGVVRRLREYEAVNVDPEVRVAAPDPDRDLREVERLLLGYPLPPEDGVRADDVEGDGPEAVGMIVGQAMQLAARWGGFWELGDSSPEEIAFMEDLQLLMELCRRHRLRQPPPPPAAGVSKDLPEAAPSSSQAPAAEPLSDLWRCGCGWIGAVSEMTQAGVATWCPNCGTIGYKLTRVGVGMSAAPPSGVDREEIDRLRFLLTQAVDFLRGGGTPEARKRWADAVERDLAIPEAKPLTPGPPASTLPT